MDPWILKEDCTGCGVCSNICPKMAIEMKSDECGFIYPVIDQEKCVNCLMCQKVCPVNKKPELNRYDTPKVYAAWSLNSENRFKSTSGGIFTELARCVINEGGAVAGAAYDKDNMVCHILAKSQEEIDLIRQSKYLQSNPQRIYREVKEQLDKGVHVAFAGAPCQVAALQKYLKKVPDNLLTIEFICRGMNSPKAYRCWLDEVERKNRSKATRVWFKYKEHGWKSSPTCTRIDFENGKYVVLSGKKNSFMVGYLGPNLYIRPSCGSCRFKDTPRQADITVADFWGIADELDDDQGTSMVLLNSNKGECWFNKASNGMFKLERAFDEIKAGNVCFAHSVKVNPKSEEFLKGLSYCSFEKQLRKYTKVSIIKKVICKIKWVLRL